MFKTVRQDVAPQTAPLAELSQQVCHLLNKQPLLGAIAPNTPDILKSHGETQKRKGDAMRKRNHFIGLWLDDKEYCHLLKQCSVSGLSASSLIRQNIMDIELRPRPPETYAALLRELSAIGNNVNQIAYWANAQKSISKADVLQATTLVKEAWRLIKDAT